MATIDIKQIFSAQKNKPKFGSPCNHCGWCCMTEVCSIGQELSGSAALPCKYLETEDSKHTCKLAKVEQIRTQLAIGVGCDAKTQSELIAEFS